MKLSINLTTLVLRNRLKKSGICLIVSEFEKELPEALEVVGIEQIDAGGEQLAPEGLSVRGRLIRRRPEAYPPAFLVRRLNNLPQFEAFFSRYRPMPAPGEMSGPMVADQWDQIRRSIGSQELPHRRLKAGHRLPAENC